MVKMNQAVLQSVFLPQASYLTACIKVNHRINATFLLHLVGSQTLCTPLVSTSCSMNFSGKKKKKKKKNSASPIHISVYLSIYSVISEVVIDMHYMDLF